MPQQQQPVQQPMQQPQMHPQQERFEQQFDGQKMLAKRDKPLMERIKREAKGPIIVALLFFHLYKDRKSILPNKLMLH